MTKGSAAHMHPDAPPATGRAGVGSAAVLLFFIAVLHAHAMAWAQEDALVQTDSPAWENPGKTEAAVQDGPAPSGQTPFHPAPAPDYFRAHQSVWETPVPSMAGNPVEPTPAATAQRWQHYATRSLMGLFFVCGGIVLLGYFLRRYGKQNPLLTGHRLGVIAGKLHLGPKASLYFVRAGGRVLVVGVTPASVSLVAEFDGEGFEAFCEPASAPAAPAAKNQGFLAQLEAQTGKMQRMETPPDDDLASLRGDIQRLRHYLQESARGDTADE